MVLRTSGNLEHTSFEAPQQRLHASFRDETNNQHQLLTAYRSACAHVPFLIVWASHEPVVLEVVMVIWVVSGGEAITVSIYDPKAVQNLDITFLCGWWAELGIPPLKSMAISGLWGVAGMAYSSSASYVYPDA